MSGMRPAKLLLGCCAHLALATVARDFCMAGERLAGHGGLSSLMVRPTGQIVELSAQPHGDAQSDDGRYWCRYRVAAAGDEVRDLADLAFYEEGRLMWRMAKAPGSDLYVSNAGLVAFVATERHWAGEVTIHFYSKTGRCLTSLPCKGASLFGFSPSGKLFAVGSAAGLQVVDPASGTVSTLEHALQFDFSEDDSLLALALPGRVLVKKGSITVLEAVADVLSPRGVRVSAQDSLVAVIGRQVLVAFSLSTGHRLLVDSLRGRATYRDVRVVDGRIIAGVQVREKDVLRGLLRVLERDGRLVAQEEGERLPLPRGGLSKQGLGKSREGCTPWPFAPFDSMRTVWNYYEQHMAYGDSLSYLHQGLDLITPIGEHVYAVEPGVVKCLLTLGGNSYWRVAIAPQQSAEPSVGWLYAHLVKESITCAPGDTVELHEYLGDIVRWTPEWGHIHFVQIWDSGLVWRYDDDQWGIVGNPLLQLCANTDTIPPRILDVFPDSKFGICLNESSAYLRPDSVYGDVDFIVQVADAIGDGLYELPALELYYWIVSVDRGALVVPRTKAQRLDHAYPFYSADRYVDYATLIYKRDAILPPPSWMPNRRNFYHLLTNSDGDDKLDLGEHQLAFVTTGVPDGQYRLHVLARDLNQGVRDSMDFRVANGPAKVKAPFAAHPLALGIYGPFPNPFGHAARVEYTLPEATSAVLRLFDVAGREVRHLEIARGAPGRHSIHMGAEELPNGIYFLHLQQGHHSVRRKCVVLRELK
ncbi:MAG: hypothetical protein ONB07_01620 [candidate division KSB1 bacterium]|nr:hypothetical protein [candidate division KSB1 bacterium]